MAEPRIHESYWRALLAVCDLEAEGRRWVTPTEVGTRAQPSRAYGSPWASPKLRWLADNGYLARHPRRKGWVRLSPKGAVRAEELRDE